MAPDLVVISQGSSFDGVWYAAICRIIGIPYTVIVQSVNDQDWLSDYQSTSAIHMFQDAVKVFFLSPSNKAMIERQLATSINNHHWIQNPYNVRWEAAPAWPNSSDFHLACVARLDPACKGQDVLIDVLSQEKWRKRPLKLTFFGSGRQAKIVQRLVKMRSLENIKFGGFVDDIEKIWTQHHAFILPSRNEGLPLALVEAMLCSRFGIVTDIAGNTDMIEDNKSGFVSLAPHRVLLDEALERAWKLRGEWQEIGQRAGEKARAIISRDPVGDFADIIKSLV